MMSTAKLWGMSDNLSVVRHRRFSSEGLILKVPQKHRLQNGEINSSGIIIIAIYFYFLVLSLSFFCARILGKQRMY